MRGRTLPCIGLPGCTGGDHDDECPQAQEGRVSSSEASGAVEELERLCEVMHDAYEHAAAREGWETQERSRKPWAEVPEANKATMRHAVLALLFDLNANGRLRTDLTRPKGDRP